MLFEGYTGGGSKDVIDGLMATGDVGRMDDAGRLFVEGRDDEMIVSGGENLFPKEVEDTLARHPGVAEAAAIGVEDEKFGQRLRAFVVSAGDDEPERGRAEEVREAEPRRRSRCRARSGSSTSCRATPPARCSSASCGRWRARRSSAGAGPVLTLSFAATASTAQERSEPVLRQSPAPAALMGWRRCSGLLRRFSLTQPQ